MAALFNGENMPLAAGIMLAACWSRSRMELKRFNETWLLQRSLVKSLAIDFALVSVLKIKNAADALTDVEALKDV